MQPHNYAQALFDSLSRIKGDEREKRLTNFLKLLESNAHTRLLPQIVEHLEDFDRTEKSRRTITVTSSQEIDEKESEKIVKQLKEFSNIETPLIQTSINKNLLGGVTVRSHNKRVDTSYKTKLLQLYEKLAYSC